MALSERTSSFSIPPEAGPAEPTSPAPATAEVVRPPAAPLSATSTLEDAWRAWLARPRGDRGTNADRSDTDRANHYRALELLALGARGEADLGLAPISELALEPSRVRELVHAGAVLHAERLGRPRPIAKTLGNLAANALRVRTDLLTWLDRPGIAPASGRQLRQRLPRRPAMARFAFADWPASLRRDWAAFDAYRTDRYHAGPGHEHRGKPVRRKTADGTRRNLGQLVRFCVQVEGLTELRLADLADRERLLRFRAWYFGLKREGGHDAFRNACVAAGVVARYLCAAGLAFPEHRPDSKAADAPWSRLYALGRETREQAAADGLLVGYYRVRGMTPRDLLDLSDFAWTTAPRSTRTGSTEEFPEFNRRRSAVFLGLAPFMPVRKRNWLDMRWGKNLFLNGRGRWEVRLRGEELKIGQRKGKTNEYGHELPPLACLLIERWRAYLAATVGPDFEARVPNVMVGRGRAGKKDGERPWRGVRPQAFSDAIGNVCLERRGHDLPVHQVRHIVATSLVNASGTLEQAQVAADLLGDTLETVLATYYRPDKDKLRNDYFAKLEAERATG